MQVSVVNYKVRSAIDVLDDVVMTEFLPREDRVENIQKLLKYRIVQWKCCTAICFK